MQGAPVMLKEGSTLRFAASSREYVLRQGARHDSDAQHNSAAAPEPPVSPVSALTMHSLLCKPIQQCESSPPGHCDQ